jgi:hypothetical protein
VAQELEDSRVELNRRHRFAVTVIVGVLALTLVLMLLSVTGLIKPSFNRNPALEGSLRIAIGVFGLGAIVLRRTKFASLRLYDIAALGGERALLETLQKTTVLLALLAATIAIMGFVLSLYDVMDSDKWLGIVAIAVLLYAYPRRSAWEKVLEMSGRTRSDNSQTAKGTIA